MKCVLFLSYSLDEFVDDILAWQPFFSPIALKRPFLSLLFSVLVSVENEAHCVSGNLTVTALKVIIFFFSQYFLNIFSLTLVLSYSMIHLGVVFF